MYQITLINMPFASLNMPSIALTQLRSVAEEKFGEEVRVRVLYLNQEFCNFIGVDLYQSMSFELYTSGLGDWFFRHIAFREEEDNTQQYFARYFPQQNAEAAAIKGRVLAKRKNVERFLMRLIAKYQLDKEQMVGFTSMFTQNVACFAMARLLKEKNDDVVTILGGANCEAAMGREIARHADSIDYVFSGPSLVSFTDFLGHQISGETDKCHEVQGVFSSQNAEDERHSGRGIIGQELPIEIPVPLDYDSFLKALDTNLPKLDLEPCIPFETSRGCWWGERSHCTFCGLNGGTMAYRAMPSENALALFDDLFTKYGGRSKRFESVDNILPRNYLTEVLPNIKAPEDAYLFYEVKADLKTHEMEILANAGVKAIQPGIESLNTSTLKLMGKGTTSFQNLAFLKNCSRFGIIPTWNLLIGFPGEGEEVYEKYLGDIPLLTHLYPPNGAFPVRFDRFSPYYTQAAQYGLDLSPYDFYSLIYPFPQEALANMAYFFEDRNYKAKYMAGMIAWKDKLNTGVGRWRTRYNGKDEAPKARLDFEMRDDQVYVVDTRDGEAVEYAPDELELSILCTIDMKGQNVRAIAKKVDASPEAVESAIGGLRERRLIFHENERFSSLVMFLEKVQPAIDIAAAVLGRGDVEGAGVSA